LVDLSHPTPDGTRRDREAGSSVLVVIPGLEDYDVIAVD
jgi:hypothetical protein